MSGYKVGDYIICEDGSVNNEIGKIVRISGDLGCHVDFIYDINSDDGRIKYNYPILPNEIVSTLPINNNLNKKLYPDHIEWNDYLIPQKFAAKVKKDSSEL